MSTTTTTTPTDTARPAAATPAAPAERQGIRPIGFGRLVRVELRKTVDTIAGLWLMIVLAVIALGAMTAFQIWGPAEEVGFFTHVEVASLPLVLLVPIIGTLAATSEWSQRTGLVTFALEPRRGRVVGAKLVAAVVVMTVLYAVTVGSAAAVHAFGGGGDWSVDGLKVVGLLATLVLFVLQGSAFGFAFLNTPFAIVASLVLPTAWTVLSGIFAGVERVGVWLDLSRATTPLSEGAMSGPDWAHLATSTGVWVLLPLAVGTWRVLTREVK